MKIDILTAFPNAFSYFGESIIKRAKEKGHVEINIIDLRDFTTDTRKTIDDKPFGGGAGMLLKVEPVYKALKSLGVYPKTNSPKSKVILTSAKGKTWNQNQAKSYSIEIEHLVIICGHYEGFDDRVTEHLVDEEVSIGNYILSGGELASQVIVDSITRLIPGVVGNEESVQFETEFDAEGKVIPEHPHYTRPETFITDEGEEWKVPPILLSGDHAEILKWRMENNSRQ